MSAFSKRIRDLRRARGWKPVELARRAGISRAALDRIEQGHPDAPQVETLSRISQALGVAPELLTDTAHLPAVGADTRFERSDPSPGVLAITNSSPPAPSPHSNPSESSVVVTSFDESNFPAVNTAAWGLMNRRRVELIRKKNRHGLTDAEQIEFDRLQRLTFEALDEAFPRPDPNVGELILLREKLRAEVERR